MVGFYPNDTLTINFKYFQIKFKVDQGDFRYKKIKDLLSLIKNKQKKHQQWTCYSEIRNFYLNIDQEFRCYPNDKLVISTQHQMKCNQFSLWLYQMQSEIKDKFKQIKGTQLDVLISKEQKICEQFNKFRQIFQLAFLQEEQKNTLKLPELIFSKKERNIQIQRNFSLLQEITNKWSLDINTLWNEFKPNCLLQIEIDQSTLGIELLEYISDTFNFNNLNRKEINMGSYLLKYKTPIDIQKELWGQIKKDDIILIGPFKAINKFNELYENKFIMEIQYFQ